MKRTTWIALFAGLAIGFAVGSIFDVMRAGDTIGIMLYMPFHQSSESAFSAYKTGDPKIGIWTLQQHLSRLDEFAKQGFPDTQEILRQRFITHARLAQAIRGAE